MSNGDSQLSSDERARQAAEAARAIPVEQDQVTRHGTRLRRGVAKITANDEDGAYTVTEQLWDSDAGPAAWADGKAPFRHVTTAARDFLDRESGQVDDVVRFWEQRQQNGALEVLLDVVTTGVMFAVLVWRDGGTTDGDLTHQCDRTYTAKTLDGNNTLGEDLTPKKRRPSVGMMDTPPTDGGGIVGLGYYEADGTFCLYDANETLEPGPCP